jgi:hypothetical protein
MTLKPGRVWMLLGARRVGKTRLIEDYLFQDILAFEQLHKEVSKTMRYYFVDNGIRNAVIQNFQPIDQRSDRGVLWENFFVNERRRLHAYTNTGTRHYFWRTYDQQEIDLVEVSSDGSLEAFECKWQDKKHRSPGAWKNPIPKPPFNSYTQKTLWTFS